MGNPKTILVAWELGGGMGHINRLLKIARELSTRGHRLVFAFRDLQESAVVSREIPGALIVRAPIFRAPPPAPGAQKKPAAYNYADVLHRCGYASAADLLPLVQAWQRLFEAVKPSMMLCDHSPTAVLAAAGRFPVVHIGSGFATPPTGRPFLALRPSSVTGAKEREAQVLEAIRQVQARLGGPTLQEVHQLLGFAENFSCCLSELDPYQSVRAVPATGPVEALAKPQPPGSETFLFGYLTGQDVGLPVLLASLAKAKILCGIYVRQKTAECDRAVASSTVKLYATPQKLPEILATASAILHHGGLSTSETALALGRPQFLFPRNLEQALTADAIQRLGCGVNLVREKTDPGEMISRALKQKSYDKAVSSTAARIAVRPHVDVAATIVQACLKHLG